MSISRFNSLLSVGLSKNNNKQWFINPKFFQREQTLYKVLILIEKKTRPLLHNIPSAELPHLLQRLKTLKAFKCSSRSRSRSSSRSRPSLDFFRTWHKHGRKGRLYNLLFAIGKVWQKNTRRKWHRLMLILFKVFKERGIALCVCVLTDPWPLS